MNLFKQILVGEGPNYLGGKGRAATTASAGDLLLLSMFDFVNKI